MKIQRSGILTAAVFMLLPVASAQSFVNLNFEQATIAPTPPGGWMYPADPAQCFPGWTVGGSGTVVSYNDLSLGAPAVNLMGPQFPNLPNYLPLEGYYSVLFQYFEIAGPPPSVSQTGLIPAGTQSINFLVGPGQSDAAVSVNGIPIPLVWMADGRLAGNVSAFADTEALLTISTSTGNGFRGDWLYIDDIQFSSEPVPEPAICSTISVSALLFIGIRRGLVGATSQFARRCARC